MNFFRETYIEQRNATKIEEQLKKGNTTKEEVSGVTTSI
jgi:hypothetical protein